MKLQICEYRPLVITDRVGYVMSRLLLLALGFVVGELLK